MRTVPYFHNMVGILTETSHASASPRYYAPDSIPATVAGRGGGGFPTTGTDVFYPYPWKGGESRLKDPIRYMMTASMAVLRIASDRRTLWLRNIYRMGRDAIEQTADSTFAYVISPDQWDRAAARDLVDVLATGGVEAQRATEPFSAGGKHYPTGTFVIRTAQAFRPYLIDLMEVQAYPDRRSAPGGPPDPPYDLAGWTLPLQMGVTVDRVYQAFDASLAAVNIPVPSRAGTVSGSGGAGYVFRHRSNRAVLAANRLMGAGESVSWADSAFNVSGASFSAGTYFVAAQDDTGERVLDLASDLGVDFIGVESIPSISRSSLHLPRVAIYKSWQAQADEGWTRWLLERYAFAPDTLHDSDVRTADLSAYDAIILPSQSASGILNGYAPGTMPDEYVGGLGLEGALALEDYVRDGGRIIALDAASDLVTEQFGLPVTNALGGLSSRQFFIPGSLVRMEVDTTDVLAYGMQPEVAAVFDRSRAFRTRGLSDVREGGRENLPPAPAPDIRTVATYADHDILMSGWALGEETYLAGKAALMHVRLGRGHIILFGFRPQFRGQPRGTYKLLFNAIQEATIERH